MDLQYNYLEEKIYYDKQNKKWYADTRWGKLSASQALGVEKLIRNERENSFEEFEAFYSHDPSWHSISKRKVVFFDHIMQRYSTLDEEKRLSKNVMPHELFVVTPQREEAYNNYLSAEKEKAELLKKMNEKIKDLKAKVVEGGSL